jgi:hypothetical protein
MFLGVGLIWGAKVGQFCRAAKRSVKDFQQPLATPLGGALSVAFRSSFEALKIAVGEFCSYGFRELFRVVHRNHASLIY